MKKLLFTLLSTLFFFSSYSQNTQEAKIRELESEMRTAHLKRDSTVLFKLLSPDYVVTSPWNKIATMEDIRNTLRKGIGDTVFFEKNIERVTFTNNIAIVMGQETRIIAGKTDKRRFTDIWMSNKNNWQIVARQSTIYSVE